MTIPDFKRGSSFAGYRIVERLGTTVFHVEDRRGRAGALRLLPDASHDLLARCFSEACNASQLAHPAIARTYDVGVAQGRAFVVTELVDGESLARWLRRARPLPLAEALRLAHRIATVLVVMHQRGLAHGALDFESFVIADRKLSLMGFGLAALGGGDPMACVEALPLPIYTSPEQCRAAAAYDARSDLYAFGCMLFQLLTGQPPFRSTRMGELVTSHLLAPPPALPDSIPAALRDLVSELLAKAPDARPSAVVALHTLAGALEELEQPASPWAPMRWLAAIAVSVCFVIPMTYQNVVEKTPDLFHTLDVPSLPR